MNTPELHRQIAERAYTIWQREGRPLGLDREHWLRAEHELAAEMIAGAEHAEFERLFDQRWAQVVNTPDKRIW